jgi:hypothetical protein
VFANPIFVRSLCHEAYKKDSYLGAAKDVEIGTVKVGAAAGALMTPWNPALGKAAGAAVTEGAIGIGTTYISPQLANVWIWGDQKFFGGQVFGVPPAN